MEQGREVRFEIPFHIRAPDGFSNSNAIFYPRVGDFPIGLGFEIRSEGQMRVGGMATVRKDKFGTIVRSGVRAIFDSEFEKLLPEDLPDKEVYPSGKWFPDRDGYYIHAAVTALNKLLTIYREETGSFWIHPLEMGDIGEFEIQDYEEGSLVNTTDRTVTRGGTVLGGVGEEDLQRIQNRLTSQDSPSIYQTLHLDIREKIDQQEFSVSVLLSYILFERWVKNAFVAAVAEDDGEREEAKELIMKGDGEYEALKNILLNIFEHHTDVNFRGSELYEEWDDDVYEERNRVVHEDYTPDGESADKTHKVTIESIEWLRDELGSAIKDTPEDVSFASMREMENEE